MSSFSREFLEATAHERKLSPKQEAVFVELYCVDTDELKVAEYEVVDKLHISHGALRTRLTEIYRKFDIEEKGPGKFRQLKIFLLEKQQATSGPAIAGSTDGGDIDALVQDVRQKVYGDIKVRCGTIRVLDMTQPIGLGDIYTDVNILETILGRRRKEITELLEDCDLESFNRSNLGGIQQERVPGLEAVERHAKLMILGKPGAGKTTFLKRLATLCNLGEFQTQRIPVFVTLKDFAEADNKPDFLTYIAQQWSACGVQDTEIAESVMNQGHALVLLDGLDEVQETEQNRVLREIQGFTNQFRACQFVITCRIAAREYTFEQFTEVEVADFKDEQIAEFAANWFKVKKDPVKADTFIKKLKDNRPIRELATSPLLLTLLCLVFGEAADFPRNRSDLYKEGLDVLLKKWDAKRNIERDQVYKKLSLKRKEDLLSQLALDMFTQNDYFFKQKTVEVKIAQYIQNLPDAKTDPEALQLDSEAVLKSIEAQHGLLVERARGIYSFSHLTFQEYFTAKRIVNSPATESLKALEDLSNHITDHRWREVFLLVPEMLLNADSLLALMKDQVDSLLAEDDQLQSFLTWGREKTRSVEFTCQPAAVRAFYLGLALDHACACTLDHAYAYARDRARFLSYTLDHALIHALDSDCAVPSPFAPDIDHVRDLALDRALASTYARAHRRRRTLIRTHALDLILELGHALKHTSEPALEQSLHNLTNPLLENSLPQTNNDVETFQQWWKTNSNVWTENLRAAMIEHRNIAHDWQFSHEQLGKLVQYYAANQLLLACLNSDCHVTLLVREEIEDNLLLPVTT